MQKVLFVGHYSDLIHRTRPGRGRFNTFRKGSKWAEAAKPGNVVELCFQSKESDVVTPMWKAHVVEIATGPLSSLLDKYALKNVAAADPAESLEVERLRVISSLHNVYTYALDPHEHYTVLVLKSQSDI